MLLYVDDVMARGESEQIGWIFKRLGERFDCKDAAYIGEDTPQDYLGMIAGQKDDTD